MAVKHPMKISAANAPFAMPHGLRSSAPAGNVPVSAAGAIRAMRRGRPLVESKAVRLAVPLRWKQPSGPLSDGF